MSKTDELKKLSKKLVGSAPEGRRASDVVEYIADNLHGNTENTDTISEAISYLTDVYTPVETQEKDVTITENGEIEITADEGYDALEKVNLTVNVGSNVEIHDCRNLFYNSYRYSEMLDILPLCKNITNTDNMFYNAFNAQKFTEQYKQAIEDLQVDSNCTALNNMFTNAFYYYPAQSSLDLKEWDTSNVTNFSACLKSNTGLNNIDISTWDFSSVTDTNLYELVSGDSGLNENSLRNIIHALLTVPTTYNRKTLAHIGLSSAQATTCTSFDEWTTLSANGWTTGY